MFSTYVHLLRVGPLLPELGCIRWNSVKSGWKSFQWPIVIGSKRLLKVPNAIHVNIERIFVQLHPANQLSTESPVWSGESTQPDEVVGGWSSGKKGDEAVYVREVQQDGRDSWHQVIDLQMEPPQLLRPNC